MEIDKKMEIAQIRSRLMKIIREFFESRGHVEVETPIVSPQTIPESVIDTFSTTYTDPYKRHIPLRLLPSPELWMKRLLSAGSGSIYQLTKSFRNSESVGPYHNPEFTMLEWYTVGADYTASMETAEDLLQTIAAEFTGLSLPKKWLPSEKMTVREAFLEFAGLDLKMAFAKNPVSDYEGESRETWFNRIFLTNVEPNLPADKALFLSDYPAAVPCLAEPVSGTPWLERWELYIGGVEIANCFTEERDETRVRQFMEQELAEILDTRRGTVPADFPRVCAAMPPCSGVALGVDRLLMAATGAKNITEVLLFPFPLFF